MSQEHHLETHMAWPGIEMGGGSGLLLQVVYLPPVAAAALVPVGLCPSRFMIPETGNRLCWLITDGFFSSASLSLAYVAMQLFSRPESYPALVPAVEVQSCYLLCTFLALVARRSEASNLQLMLFSTTYIFQHV